MKRSLFLSSRYREARLDAFRIDFQGNRHLDDLLASMACFMSEGKPKVG